MSHKILKKKLKSFFIITLYYTNKQPTKIMLAQINLEMNKDKSYTFDIDEIENIEVYVVLEYKQYLRIKAKNIYRYIDDDSNDNITIFTHKILENDEKIFNEIDLEKITDILNNLKFNKIKGCFILNEIDKDNTTIEELKDKDKFYKKLNSNIKVKKTYDDCSICLEPTMCKGKCGHYCCYICWNKINEYICEECEESDGYCECEDEMCQKQRCPICRQHLIVE